MFPWFSNTSVATWWWCDWCCHLPGPLLQERLDVVEDATHVLGGIPEGQLQHLHVGHPLHHRSLLSDTTNNCYSTSQYHKPWNMGTTDASVRQRITIACSLNLLLQLNFSFLSKKIKLNLSSIASSLVQLLLLIKSDKLLCEFRFCRGQGEA